MGILNLTPDSFSDGGQFLNPDLALKRALQMEQEGADFLDIGGESTRPGAEPVSEEEEIRRLFPLLEKIVREVRIPISVDTTKSRVADLALEKGAVIVNDVSGLHQDPKMISVVRKHGAGIILMHRRGTPQTMQSLTHYRDLISEVEEELLESVRLAGDAGIAEEQIAIDPGIGFAKTAEQNFEIVKSLERFKRFGRPLVVGASRKSFLGKATGRSENEREFASEAVHALLVERGANILRVHDVRAAKDACLVASAVTFNN